MRKNLQTAFSTRQYMVAQDFEIYYYNDQNLEKVALHSHDYYEFYFFLEGDVSIQIGQETFPIKYGDIMLMPPHIPHKPIIHSHEVPYRRFVFWISQEYCNHLMQLSPDYVYLMQYVQTSKTYLFHNDRITFNNIQSLILRLIEEMHSERFGRDAQITLCVNDLVLCLNRLIYVRNVPSSPSEEQDLYRQLTAYIEEHLDEDLSVDSLSKRFYLSRYYLMHRFKAVTGYTVHQYISQKRLLLAGELIRQGVPVMKAAEQAGFAEYSTFLRAFQNTFHMSPREFR